jgi:hypothetical protein
MKEFEISFVVECEDGAELGDISYDLDRLLERWIEDSDSFVLRAYQRDVEER